MKPLGENNLVKLAHLFTRLLWYLFLIISVIIPVILLLGYFGALPHGLNHVITIPISSSAVSLNANLPKEVITFGAASVDIAPYYIARQYPNFYITLSLDMIFSLCLFMLGLYQLKKLLESVMNAEVFTRHNIRRIKTIALLVFLVDPIKWIFREFIIVKPDFVGDAAENSIRIGLSMEVSYWFMGLLLFVLALIFERGYKMYQELKLTV